MALLYVGSSSLTEDRTCSPCIGRFLYHKGSPGFVFDDRFFLCVCVCWGRCNLCNVIYDIHSNCTIQYLVYSELCNQQSPP